ncbi:hypothetical protein DAPPUDRAFT_327832 [Daphnia pulex]|uniref:Uncharacterized protein n=1 Tax=Daphnia pulex TaxID=6669 RepID=E9HBX6_DAPPU|nr:hypothetical protein DAPPUDRAFT_327832 [Daphnia pulex]|eukprot:EFX70794.1 hypothetical protein DAPPUDRAFT_327832 [Daphnia pulex]
MRCEIARLDVKIQESLETFQLCSEADFIRLTQFEAIEVNSAGKVESELESYTSEEPHDFESSLTEDSDELDEDTEEESQESFEFTDSDQIKLFFKRYVAEILIDYKRTIYSQTIDISSKKYPNIRSDVHLRSAQRLLKLCEEHGGAFIKVGQHLGALDYLIPAEYVSTMKVLHSQAPQSAYDEVLKSWLTSEVASSLKL